jgi:uncharacterized RDD family membrane protein YckC
MIRSTQSADGSAASWRRPLTRAQSLYGMEPTRKEEQKPSSEPGLEPPSLGRLWEAALLDAILGLSSWAVCALGLLELRNLPENPFALPRGILPVLLGLAVLLHLSYHVLCIGRFGQTLGKSALGIAVVRQDGAPAGYGRALLRSVGGMMAVLTQPLVQRRLGRPLRGQRPWERQLRRDRRRAPEEGRGSLIAETRYGETTEPVACCG